MPKPTIPALRFIALKNGIDGRAMSQMVLEFCSGQVVESAHIAGIGRLVVAIVLLVDMAKLRQKGLHDLEVPPDDATIEQGGRVEGVFKSGILGYALAQVGPVRQHPGIVQDSGLIAAKQGVGVLQKKRLQGFLRHAFCFPYKG